MPVSSKPVKATVVGYNKVTYFGSRSECNQCFGFTSGFTLSRLIEDGTAYRTYDQDLQQEVSVVFDYVTDYESKICNRFCWSCKHHKVQKGLQWCELACSNSFAGSRIPNYVTMYACKDRYERMNIKKSIPNGIAGNIGTIGEKQNGIKSF